MGHGRGVHGPRCLPSHLPNNGKAVESRHIPIEFLHTFHGDIDACTTVAVVLTRARPTLEPLLVAVRSLRMSAHRTPLTSVLGVNPSGRNRLERRLVRRIELEGAEREVVQASVHPRAVVDAVAHLFEVFKDDARLLELLAPLHDVSRHLVESVTDEPFLTPFQRVVDAVLPCVLHALSHCEVAVALERDLGKVNNERVFDAILGECGEGHVVLVHVHANDRS